MRGKSFLQRASAFVLSLIFVLFSADIVSAWNFKKDKPVPEAPKPALKIYARCETVETAVTAKNLSAKDFAFDDISALYDGDKGTVFGDKKSAEVILDLGGIHMLGGVRLSLPEYDSLIDKSRCIGTEFYVSKDKKSYIKAAELESVTENLENELAELMFSGAGEYRYVKAVIPQGVKISEIEWLEYPEWKYTNSKQKGKKNMTLRLCGYDAQRELDTRIVASIYNADGVLKEFKTYGQQFYPGADKEFEVSFSDLTFETGDSCRIMVWDRDGTPLLANTLVYRCGDVSSKFYVSPLFSDDMVIQAEKPFKVWGKAPMGSTVTVSLENLKGGLIEKSIEVKDDSEWEIELGSFTAGGDYTLKVTCAGEVKTFENMTFGDVWLCTGQSNMEYYMLCGDDTIKYMKSEQGREDMNACDVRYFSLLNMGNEGAGKPLDNPPIAPDGKSWKTAEGTAAGYCSAIGYYFGQMISSRYDIPIGLLNIAVGDTEINRWLPQGQTFGSVKADDGGLFNNRISPMSKLQICGIIMYQGEADEYRTHMTAAQYRDAMAGMVDSYREIWGSDIPFYWAQLTRYGRDESEVREGQRLAQYSVKEKSNTGVISLIDIYGEYRNKPGSCRSDIHPHQKREAAERFVRLAERDVYGDKDIRATGPEYRSTEIIGNKIELTFDCTGELTVMEQSRYADAAAAKLIKKTKTDTSKPCEFEIAGADGVFKKAAAEIRGNKIILYSDEVVSPMAARYAWGAYPEAPNLTDASGLPALSFTTEEAE